MNRYTVLHQTADLAVRRFDHPPHEVHHDPDGEVAAAWAIAFVRRGGFRVVLNSRRHRLVGGSVFITRPGLEFRCEHDAPLPDDVCLSVAFAPSAVLGAEDAWARAGWAARESPTPRLAYVQGRLANAAAAGDRFEIERWALAGLTALEMDSRTARVRGPYAARRTELDAVTAISRAIEADPAARRSVADRARHVGMTSTRLTHAFRRYVGVSPHRYVVRWRLVTAATLLDQGFGVTDSCLRSGFENLSQFCRAFRRAFGSRASRWRALPVRERRRIVQAFLRGPD